MRVSAAVYSILLYELHFGSSICFLHDVLEGESIYLWRNTCGAEEEWERGQVKGRGGRKRKRRMGKGRVGWKRRRRMGMKRRKGEGGSYFKTAQKYPLNNQIFSPVGNPLEERRKHLFKSLVLPAAPLWLKVTANVMKVSRVRVKRVMSSSGRQRLVRVLVPFTGLSGGRKDQLSVAGSSAKEHPAVMSKYLKGKTGGNFSSCKVCRELYLERTSKQSDIGNLIFRLDGSQGFTTIFNRQYLPCICHGKQMTTAS